MRPRIAASIALIGALAATLTSCTFVTPQATQNRYDPSDGVSGTVGDLQLRNVLVVTSEDGGDGNVLLTVVNEGETDDLELTLQYEGEGERTDESVEIGADSTDVGYNEGDEIRMTGVDLRPGQLVPIYFQYGEEQGLELQVPVLDGSLEQYADYVPEPEPTEAPTPDPTEPATPSPTPSAAP